MTPKDVPGIYVLSVTDPIDNEWTYCPRCDEEEIMVPKGPKHWECIKCGVSIKAERIEKDVFMTDQNLTIEEVKRHSQYCLRVAEKQLKELANPGPMPWRVKVIFTLARILKVGMYGLSDQKGKSNKS